jgi:hypothetical protein
MPNGELTALPANYIAAHREIENWKGSLWIPALWLEWSPAQESFTRLRVVARKCLL